MNLIKILFLFNTAFSKFRFEKGRPYFLTFLIQKPSKNKWFNKFCRYWFCLFISGSLFLDF